MNPTVPQRVIDEATERDPASAAAEYGAQFRTDVESFVNREAVEACVSVGVERRTARGGRDSIDHAPGAHDDVANAVAGVVDVLTARSSVYDSMRWVSGPYDEDDDGPPVIRTPRGTGRADSRH